MDLEAPAAAADDDGDDDDDDDDDRGPARVAAVPPASADDDEGRTNDDSDADCHQGSLRPVMKASTLSLRRGLVAVAWATASV